MREYRKVGWSETLFVLKASYFFAFAHFDSNFLQKKNLKQHQKIINFSARVVTGRRKFDHISDVLNGPGWLSARQLADYHCLTLTHSILEGGEPSSLASFFNENSDIRSRHTRQDGQLHLPRIRSEAGRRQFAYRAPHHYNRLPLELTRWKQNSFKLGLKLLLKCDSVT